MRSAAGGNEQGQHRGRGELSDDGLGGVATRSMPMMAAMPSSVVIAREPPTMTATPEMMARRMRDGFCVTEYMIEIAELMRMQRWPQQATMPV